MAPFYVQRRGASLLPVTEPDQIEMLRLPERRVLTATVTLAVPPQLTRYYWAALTLLVQATDCAPTKEILHERLMIGAGYADRAVVDGQGSIRLRAVSTADWQQPDWREYIERVMPAMLDIAGETRAQFRDRVDRFFGMKWKEIAGS